MVFKLLSNFSEDYDLDILTENFFYEELKKTEAHWKIRAKCNQNMTYLKNGQLSAHVITEVMVKKKQVSIINPIFENILHLKCQ